VKKTLTRSLESLVSLTRRRTQWVCFECILNTIGGRKYDVNERSLATSPEKQGVWYGVFSFVD